MIWAEGIFWRHFIELQRRRRDSPYETGKRIINFVRIRTKKNVEPVAADSSFAVRSLSFHLGKRVPIKKFYSLNPAI